jgi:uncharacterized lipoprotein NlpE involved in copper resistance
MRALSFCLATWAFLASSAALAESMRCDQWVVDETATLEELVDKCGPPTSKTLRTEDVTTHDEATGKDEKVGTKTVERWLYRRMRSEPMVVHVVDGKIQSIERLQ